jgi:hypothetical protein
MSLVLRVVRLAQEPKKSLKAAMAHVLGAVERTPKTAPKVAVFCRLITGYLPSWFGTNRMYSVDLDFLTVLPASILSCQATGRHTVLGGIRWCFMVPPNGSETCLPLQQSLVQVQRLEGAFCKFPPIQRSYRSLGQATRALG